MTANILQGILLPFLGTTLGSACVFLMNSTLRTNLRRALTGFAAGVMTAASIWSLLIPSINQSASLDQLAFLPAAIGFWLGILFLLLLTAPSPTCTRTAPTPKAPAPNSSETPC